MTHVDTLRVHSVCVNGVNCANCDPSLLRSPFAVAMDKWHDSSDITMFSSVYAENKHSIKRFAVPGMLGYQ